jgi:hypothetical protein
MEKHIDSICRVQYGGNIFLWNRIHPHDYTVSQSGRPQSTFSLPCKTKIPQVFVYMTDLNTFSSSAQQLFRWSSTSSIKGRSRMLTNDSAVPCNENYPLNQYIPICITSCTTSFQKPSSSSLTKHLKLHSKTFTSWNDMKQVKLYTWH